MSSELISVGQLIDKSWDHYKEKFQPLIQVALWLFLSTFLHIVGMMLAPAGEPGELLFSGTLSTIEFLGTLLIILSTSVIYPLLLLWIALGLILMIEHQAVNKKMNAAKAMKETKKKFGSFVWISLLKTVVVFLPLLLIIPGILLVIMDGIQHGIDTPSAGGPLFLISIPIALGLALMFSIQFAFIGYELTLHHKKGLAALKASRNLVKGRFFAVLWRYLIPRMVFGTFGVVLLMAALAVLGMSLSTISLASPAGGLTITNVFVTILATAITVLILPITTLADYYLFDSLRKTK